MKKPIVAVCLFFLFLLTACTPASGPTGYTCTVWPEGGIRDALGADAQVPAFEAESYDVVLRTVDKTQYISIVCDGGEEAVIRYRDALRAAGYSVCQVQDGIYYMADLSALSGGLVTAAGRDVIECAFRTRGGKLEIGYNLAPYNMIFHTDRFIDNSDYADMCAMLRYVGEGFWSEAAGIPDETARAGMDRLRATLRAAADAYDRITSILANYAGNGYTRAEDGSWTKKTADATVTIRKAAGFTSETTQTAEGTTSTEWRSDSEREVFAYTSGETRFETSFDRAAGAYRLQLTDADGVVRAILSAADYTFRLQTAETAVAMDDPAFLDATAVSVSSAPGHRIPLMYY
ncbi:MAG: hypothetical protein KIG36_00300 [Eubacteriales bacterium]|nr:hypothetical protein [Eubacteriales bacterium]